MGNHPYVLFEVVAQLLTCKRCYYTVNNRAIKSVEF